MGHERLGRAWTGRPTCRSRSGVGRRSTIPTDVEYLFWVGCAGAFEDRAKKTTQAVAELLHMAGVEFAVLGDGETCTGDSARRSGNEFLFQMLAQQNVEVAERGRREEDRRRPARTASTRCATSTRSSAGSYEVVHHTQLLNRLVREGRLTPVTAV